METDRLTAPRQISDGPLVQAVDRLGPRPADRARRASRSSLERGDDLVRSYRYIVELETMLGREKVSSEGTSAWHHSKSYRLPPASSRSPQPQAIQDSRTQDRHEHQPRGEDPYVRRRWNGPRERGWWLWGRV